MSTKYFALLTNTGAAKLANATALGSHLAITQMAVGDGGGSLPTPTPAQTKLVNEKRRAALNALSIDPQNTNQIMAEQVIPENEGGWWIREIGLYDSDGDLIAVANCAETYKPQLQEGAGRVQTVRMILIVSTTEAITLKIDPAVVLATRQYVNDAAIEVRAYADSQLRAHIAATNPHAQYAPLNSPALTGVPTAPTAATDTNTMQIATTEFVKNSISVLELGKLAKKDKLSAADVGTWEQSEADSRYLQKTGGQITGAIYSSASDNYRIIQGDYGTYWRNDATRLWLLITNPKDQLGGFNSLRPFGVELKTGAVSFGHDVSVSGTLSAPAIRIGDSTHSADGNIFGSRWGNKWLWDAVIEQINSRVDWASFNSRTQVAGGRGGWWYKDSASGLIFQGGMVNRGGGNTNRVGFPISFTRECFGVQMTWSVADDDSKSNPIARDVDNSGFNAYMQEWEHQAYWWAVGV